MELPSGGEKPLPRALAGFRQVGGVSCSTSRNPKIVTFLQNNTKVSKYWGTVNYEISFHRFELENNDSHRQKNGKEVVIESGKSMDEFFEQS